MLNCKTSMNSNQICNAVVVDLDGTLLHSEPEQISVKGRSGFAYLAKNTEELLYEISCIAPIFIATGRNASSVKKLTTQIPHIHFSGFILENGFVIRNSLDNKNDQESNWDCIIDLLPEWERLTGYENCLGLIPPMNQSHPKNIINRMLKDNGRDGYVYSEYRKIFIYPEAPDKTKGFSRLQIHPFVSLGNDMNDLQMMTVCSNPVTLDSASVHIKNIVKNKKGYCSSLLSHAAAEDMLAWTYSKLLSSLL
jgi:hydroxymethylpyrimidine pyrophosphatase-like HAD family hydrolase